MMEDRVLAIIDRFAAPDERYTGNAEWTSAEDRAAMMESDLIEYRESGSSASIWLTDKGKQIHQERAEARKVRANFEYLEAKPEDIAEIRRIHGLKGY